MPLLKSLPSLLAAALMAATFALHVFGGGTQIHTPIQSSDLALPLRAISAVLWHAISFLLALQTLILARLAFDPNPQLSHVLAAIQIGFTALFLYYSQTMLGSIWTLPQWTIFLTLAALILWGAKPAPLPAF